MIYGGGGAIGGAVAETFAREGAQVFLAGRTAEKLEAVAERIRAAGGTAQTAQLDALDEQAVDQHADDMAASAGGIDISFNLISHGDVQGTPMAEMRPGDYLAPVQTAVRTTFLTWRAAARHMMRQGSGVILAFGGEGHPPRRYHLGALQTIFHAIEAMRRQLASKLGPHGVRVVTLRIGVVRNRFPRNSRPRADRRLDRRRIAAGARGDTRGRRPGGRVRRLRSRAGNDRSDRQHQRRRTDRLKARRRSSSPDPRHSNGVVALRHTRAG